MSLSPTTNRYLVKIAKQQEGLRPHQDEALNQLDETGGLILHHSTGSGKTKTFLTAISRELENPKNKGKRAVIFAPASLISNIDKETKKHNIKIDKSRLDAYSYEKAVNIADKLSKNKYAIAVADEAQKLRNPGTKRSQSLSDIMQGADKRLLSTATANYNHAADLAPLVNIAAGQKIMPEDRKKFEQRYLQTKVKKQTLLERIRNAPKQEYQDLKNEGELEAIFHEHIHHYNSEEDPGAVDKFPTKSERVVEVEMSPRQKQMYSFVEGQLPFWVRMKIRHNLPMDKQEKAQLNSFSVGVRQVSNGYRHFSNSRDNEDYTPKIEKAVSSLTSKLAEDKNFRGLVYSNFLDAGVNEYSRKLHENMIDHYVYTGGLSAKEKDEMVQGFNAGKKKVLVISSSGAEGLDLKGVKLTQVLEPHFNPSKIKQVIGRGARFESHSHLPPEERKLLVEHYLTVHPKPMFGKAPYSIDKYLAENSDDKAEVFTKIKDVMRRSTKRRQYENKLALGT